jgi:iron complex outermembrane receptor protein
MAGPSRSSPDPLLRATKVAAAGFVLAALPCVAQPEPDTTARALGTVEVIASPFTLAAGAAPFAIGAVTVSEEHAAGASPLTLDEITRRIPGLHVADRQNPSQGERITMRGLGWRAGFGVRGVQVLLDGIPLTMADGQAVLNAVDPAFIRRAEVIRGPASVFWGNSSGGVLALSTLRGSDAPLATVGQSVGSYGMTRTSAQVSLARPAHSVAAFASYLYQDGYRAHSDWRVLRAGGSTRIQIGPSRALEAVAVVAHVPEADAPGALTQGLLDEDRRQADPRSSPAGAGKRVDLAQIGVTFVDRFGGIDLRATAYGVGRALDNALPFGFIQLDRIAGGARFTAEGRSGRIGWGAGLEADGQRDDRTESDNLGGEPGPTVGVLQRETASNQAAFLRAEIPLGRVRLSGGARLDRIRYAVDDRLGSADGSRTFIAVSPSVGAVVLYAGGRAFANVGTGLDTPTTQELGNRPDGQPGFDFDLRPEATLGGEVGAAGRLASLSLDYDIALFALRVSDLIVPFELEPGGPTFFRNEGATRHAGLEATGTWSPGPAAAVTAAYTLLDAAFVDEAGRVPGVPAHRGALDVAAGIGGWTLNLTADLVSGYWVDSANTARNAGYAAFGARVAGAGARVGRTRLRPWAEVRNIFDAHYNASVVVNAAGGRYFEPAAGRHWRAGVSLSLE